MSISPPPIGTGHIDDEFHVPTSDSPEWSETCWFTFAVPEHNLSIQFYPYFRPNLGVVAGAVYVWDGFDEQPSTCRYAKNFWHLPMPTTPLSAMVLDNGITYTCLEPLSHYRLGYRDPDGGDLAIDLDVHCITEPLRLHSHYDQATRATGTMTLDGETLQLDCVGFRDRSWGVRSQFGSKVMGPSEHATYSWGTAANGEGFFSMCGDFGNGDQNVHGFYNRDGELSKIAAGTHRVEDRTDDMAYPTKVVIEATDELGRSFTASGWARNGLGWAINPNLYTINGLIEWSIEQPDRDDLTAHGEDHDNWSAASIRAFHRARR